MNIHKHLRGLLTVGLAVGLAHSMAGADEASAGTTASAGKSLASLRGVTLGPGGLPLADVGVVIHSLDGSSDRRIVSDSQGVFTVDALQPGPYQIDAFKDGFAAPGPIQVEIAQNLVKTEIKLLADARGQISASKQDNAPLTDRERRLLERIDRLESRLAAVEAKDTPVTATATAIRPEPAASAPAAPTLIASAARPATVATERINLANVVGAAGQSAGGALPTAGGTAAAAQSAVPSAAGAPASTTTPPPATAAPPAVDTVTPFADADWTWLNGISRQHDSPLDTKYFSPEFRADTFYGVDFNQPRDHSMGGSSEVFRNGEVQLEDLSLGGDFHAGNMRGRVLMLFGMFSATTVRNDASPGVGQWDVRAAYKYVSEAYGGYHFNVNHGLNIDAGIFVSYVGLFSYHNFDNWAYQPSYVSSNTPWFFNGVRVQWFPTNHLKIEPWFINGWQSYNKFNGHPGVGGQIRWTPKPWLNVIGNQYAVGNDNIGLPNRGRYHTDNSVEVKYYDHPKAGNGIDRMAFTFTGDAGCETGDGVTCHGGKGAYNPATGQGGPKQSFIGYMIYNRWWWHKDLFAFTLGGGQINNAGRYLTLVLPVNGADAISGTPYFPAYPGSSFKAYDGTATLDWMPSQFATFRWEFGYRHANVPYWSGRGGITPPGGNNGYPAQFVCNDGTPSLDGTTCGAVGLWRPDLRKGQALLSLSIMVKL